MSTTYKLGKTCKVCGKNITDKNKSGYCNIHRDRSGVNNSFYGKKHSKETLEKIKVNCALSSKKKWEDLEYRKHVIEGATGLKRTEEFKECQRQHALKQFQNPEQKQLRSKKMKETWESGHISINKYPSINRSKKEIKVMNALKEALGNEFKIEQTLKYIHNNTIKWLFPDGIYKNIIIEFNGDYWHANPAKYQAEEIVHHNKSAQEIWDEDLKKKNLYEQLGYKVYFIWEKDYKEDFLKLIEKTVKDLKKGIENV